MIIQEKHDRNVALLWLLWYYIMYNIDIAALTEPRLDSGTWYLNRTRYNGVEAFLYCQLEGAVGDETVTLARQQSTDIFFLVR